MHVPVRRDHSLIYVDHVSLFLMTLFKIVYKLLVRNNEDYSLELESDSALCAMAVIIL